MIEDRKLLTSRELADMLQIKETTIREWARIGKIRAVRVGRYWRFRLQDVEDWLQKQETNL